MNKQQTEDRGRKSEVSLRTHHSPFTIHHSRWRAFTLIELLVVIAIIAILAGLLFPAIKGAMTKAKRAQAKSDALNISNAIKNFYTEYGSWPVTNNGAADVAFHNTGPYFQYDIINTLRAIAPATGVNANHALNPRRIVFLESPSRKGAIDTSGYFVDPWSTPSSHSPYAIKLDTDFNDQVVVLGATYNVQITVRSSGPDKVNATATNDGDDIFSFK